MNQVINGSRSIVNSNRSREVTQSKRPPLSDIPNQPIGEGSPSSGSCCTKCFLKNQCLKNQPVIFDYERDRAVLALPLWFVWNHGCNMDGTKCVDTSDSNSP